MVLALLLYLGNLLLKASPNSTGQGLIQIEVPRTTEHQPNETFHPRERTTSQGVKEVKSLTSSRNMDVVMWQFLPSRKVC